MDIQCAQLCEKYPHLAQYIIDLSNVGFTYDGEDMNNYVTFSFGDEYFDHLFISIELCKKVDVVGMVRLYVSYFDKNRHCRQWVIKAFRTFEDAMNYLLDVDR